MNDLHTIQGKAAARVRRKAPKVRVPNVFRTPITPPTRQLHQAQHRATRRVVRAAQRIPAVQVANRNTTRLAQRENPHYRKLARRTVLKVRHTAAAPPKADKGKGPRFHILALHLLTSGPGVGVKTFGNHPFAAYTQGNDVYVTPDAVHGAFDRYTGTKKSRAYYRELPIHEYAHTLQGSIDGRSLREGGAEAFKLIASKEIGLPPVASPSYAKWAKEVLSGRGTRYVTRGQFGSKSRTR